MPFKKIINNLYLGDRYSCPENIDFIISCAEEIFNEKKIEFNIKNIEKNYFLINKKYIFFNFKDFALIKEIDKKLIIKVLKYIDKYILNNKKIYIHCIWGVNRSASIVFIYLVIKKYIKFSKFNNAFEEFKKIYPYIEPNHGWYNFLLINFPYNY